jgi:hypothetical protein
MVSSSGGASTTGGASAENSTGGTSIKGSGGNPVRPPPAGGSANVGTGGSTSGTASCPTFQDDFLPQINAPVCSKCHQGSGRLPDWGQYSTALASCSRIGSQVASGSMPPRGSGYSLSSAQRSLVANWVKLGCPNTKSDLPSTCN